MNEDYKKLYEAVSAKFDIGDYESFQSKMQTPEGRKRFYNAVSEKGFDLGDYESYENRLSVGGDSVGKPQETSGEDLQTPVQPSYESGEGTNLYVVNDSAVTRDDLLNAIDNDDFIESIRAGETNVTIESDLELQEYLKNRIKSPADNAINNTLQKESDGDESTFKILGRSLQAGASDLIADIYRTPEFVYDVAVNGYNKLLELQDMILPESMESRKIATTEELSEMTGIDNKYAENLEAYAKKKNEINEKYRQPIFESIKQGNITDAALNTAMSVTESLPFMLSMMIPSAAGVRASKMFLGTTAVMGAGRKQELSEEDGVSETQKNTNAILYGMAEATDVLIGSGAAGRAIGEVFNKSGKKSAIEFAEDVVAKIVKEKPYLSPFTEGFQEAFTSYVQNLSDRATGVDKNKDLTEGVIDAFIVGAAMGGGQGSIVQAAKITKKLLKNKQDINDINKLTKSPQIINEVNGQIDALINTGDLTEQKGEEIKNKIVEDVSVNAGIPDNIRGEDRVKANELQKKYIEVKASQEQASDPFKELYKPELDNLKTQLQELATKKPQQEKTTVEQYGDKKEVRVEPDEITEEVFTDSEEKIYHSAIKPIKEDKLLKPSESGQARIEKDEDAVFFSEDPNWDGRGMGNVKYIFDKNKVKKDLRKGKRYDQEKELLSDESVEISKEEGLIGIQLPTSPQSYDSVLGSVDFSDEASAKNISEEQYVKQMMQEEHIKDFDKKKLEAQKLADKYGVPVKVVPPNGIDGKSEIVKPKQDAKKTTEVRKEGEQVQAEETGVGDMREIDQTETTQEEKVKQTPQEKEVSGGGKKVSIGLTPYASDRIPKYKYLNDILNSPNTTKQEKRRVIKEIEKDLRLRVSNILPKGTYQIKPFYGVWGETEISFELVLDLPIEDALFVGAKLGKEFDQDAVHVRQFDAPVNDNTVIGVRNDDGSATVPYATIEFNKSLTNSEFYDILKEVGLFGGTLSENGKFALIYNGQIFEKNQSKEALESNKSFSESVKKLKNYDSKGVRAINGERGYASLHEQRRSDGEYGRRETESVQGTYGWYTSKFYNKLSQKVKEQFESEKDKTNWARKSLKATIAKGLEIITKLTPKIKNENARDYKRLENIGKIFDRMGLTDMSPEVVRAYSKLAKALLLQYKDLPIKVYPFGKAVAKTDKNGRILRNPDGSAQVDFIPETTDTAYDGSGDMINDVDENNQMVFYTTGIDTFGEKGVDYTGHPLLEQTGIKTTRIPVVDKDGNVVKKSKGETEYYSMPMVYNDLLRVVHDYIAHAASGATFGARGEERAWAAHVSSIINDKRINNGDKLDIIRALTTETRGQNTWVNFVSEKNKKVNNLLDQRRALIKDGKPVDEINKKIDELEGIEFADQKVGLLPTETIIGGYPETKQNDDWVRKNLTGNEYVSPTKEGETTQEEKEVGSKMRGFAKSAQKAFTGLKDRIQKNPENYYEPQKWATMKGRISEMTEEELIQNMDEKGLNVVKDGDENNSILAGIELINRRIADDKPIDDLVERFAKEGTKMGQLIAQFKDLNSSTPFGIMSTINKIAERKGKILSPQQKKNIQDLAQEMLKAVNKLQQHIQEKGGKATNEDIKTLKKLNKEAESKSREFYKFVAPFTPMTWSEMLQMSIQGNLITLGSQVTNVVANVGQQTILTPVNSVASLADLMSSIFTKKRVGSFDPRQFGYAWLGRYEYLKKAIKKIVFGDTSYVKGEVKNSFDPLNAAVQSLSETKVGDLIGIPQGLIPKSISENQQERLREAKKLESDGDVEAANKIRQEVLDSAKISLSDRLKKVYESTVGVPVEIMFRLLSLGDEPFRGGEIYRQRFIAAKRKGLKGEDIRRFVLMPDAKTQEEINESSKEVVFQEDGVISKMAQKSTSAIKNVAQGIKYVDPVVQFIFRLNVPFVKTPSNIISQLIDYTLPPVALAKAAYYYKKGDQRQGNRNVGVAATGYMMIAAAEFLVANGLVSAAIDWGDEDDKNIKMKVTGSNSLNITGLKRALEGGNPEYKETDDLIDISKFGITGAAILIRAERARNKIRDKRVKAANVDNDETFLESMINLLGIETLPEVIQFSFEQSFLAGTSTLLEALKGGEYEAKRWFRQMTSAASAIVLPNTLGQLNRATETYLPDTRVESLPDAINALITSKIGFAVGDNYPEFPIRVDMWGDPIRRTPEGKNPYFYQFFDITKSREVPKDQLSLEIYQLYKLTQNPKVVPNMPSRIYFDDGIKYEIPKSIDGNKLYNEYASKVQKIKRKYAESEFKKSSYKNSSIEKRVERMSNALSKYQNSFEYKKARKELIKTLKSKKFD